MKEECINFEKCIIVDLSKSNHVPNIECVLGLNKRLSIHTDIICLAGTHLSNLLKNEKYRDIDVYHVKNYLEFFFLVKRFCHKRDFFIINTVCSNIFLPFLIIKLFSYKFMVNLRSLNEFFLPLNQIRISFRLKVFLKRLIFRYSNSISVGSFVLKYYLRSKDTDNICVIPFHGLSTKSSFQSNSFPDDKLRIVIPGVVDFLKKDIKSFVDSISGHKCDLNLELIFLGKLNSFVEIQYFESLRSDFPHSIITFDHFIDEDMFDYYMSSCDVIIGAFYPAFSMPSGAREIYGISKDSGVEGHAYGYTKSCFIYCGRSDYFRKHNLNPYITSFSDWSDLAGLLSSRNCNLTDSRDLYRENILASYRRSLEVMYN